MYAAEDKKRKEEIDIRNEGDAMAYQAENTLTEMGDKIDPMDKSELEGKLAALKGTLSGTDFAAIKSATDELKNTFYKVSEKMYQQAQQAQGGNPGDMGGGFGGGNPGGGNAGGADYYDADYTVVD
jgi:molecular chaperone DnaK